MRRDMITRQNPIVYATLVPVMGGVAYASASELDFNLLQARPEAM